MTSRNPPIFLCLPIILALAGGFFIFQDGYSETVSISDFDNALQELLSKSREIEETNTRLTSKNAALRQKVDVMERELSEVKTQQDVLNDSLKKLDELQKNQGSLIESYEKKSGGVQNKLEQLKNAQTRINEDIASTKDKNQAYKEKIQLLNADLTSIGNKINEFSSKTKVKIEDEKRQMAQMLEEAKKKHHRLEQELSKAQNSLNGPSKRFMEVKSKEQISAKKFSGLNNEVEALISGNKKIQQEMKDIKNKKAREFEVIDHAIEALRKAQDGMNILIQDMSKLKKEVRTAQRKTEGQLRNWSQKLKLQNKLLTRQLALMSKPKKPAEKPKASDTLKGREAELAALSAEFKAENARLQGQIKTLISRNKMTEGKVMDYEKDVREYQERMQSVKKELAASKANPKMKMKLILKENKGKQRELQRSLASTRKKVAQYNSRLRIAHSEQRKLEEDVVKLKHDLSYLKSETDPRKEFTMEERNADLKAEIMVLTKKGEELTNILNHIEAQFLENAKAVKEFIVDHKSLKEYLNVLKTENFKLRDELGVYPGWSM